MKSILVPSFRYVASHATDVRKTFARARREMCSTASEPPPTHPGPRAVALRPRGKRAA